MVTAEQVTALARTLPRTEEYVLRDRVKFRVGRIVYLAFSPDETVMGFSFPKHERAALIAGEPSTFSMPPARDERFNWVCARLDRLAPQRMEELVVDAWLMVVPKRVGRDHLRRAGLVP